MENKKSLFMVLILVISTHIYLFAQLKLEKEPIIVAPKPTNPNKQINLKNVVLKKQEIKPVEKPIEKIVKEKVKKKLPQTKSKNIVKTVKKKKHKKLKKKKRVKPIEKIVKAEPKKIFKEKIVEKAVTKKIVEVKEKQVTAETLKAIENEYLLKLRRLIEKNKTYPNSAKRLKQMGKVYISFTIHKNGIIDDVQISKKSNFRKLNKAAAEIMSKIQKFEPIPNELKKSNWSITVPIVYQIIRS